MVQMLVGLEAINEDVYQAYRDAMMPILSRCGPAFICDMDVRSILNTIRHR